MTFTKVKIDGCLCPHCGGELYRSDKFVSCENSSQDDTSCKLFFGYVLSDGSKIPDEDIVRLCEGEMIGPYTFYSSAKNKDYKCSLQIDDSTGNVNRKFPPRGEQSDYACPHCGKKLYRMDGQYGPYLSCPNRDFRLNLEFGHHKLTDDEIRTLLNGHNTEPIELVSTKSGKSYIAPLSLDPVTEKLKPVFD